MELRHLRYFLAVAEERSLSQASARLRISQPSLGRQISDLEAFLGRQLLQRDARGVRLTSAGKAFVGHAREIVRLADSSRDIVNRALPRERVILGIPPTASHDWILELVEASRLSLPDVAVRLVELLSVELVAGLTSGTVDVAITTRRPSDALNAAELRREPFGFAVDPQRRLGERVELGPGAMDGAVVLGFSREQTPPEHDLAIREIETMSPGIRWEFTPFTTNALACALSAEADAVFCSAAIARQQLPDWRWLPADGITTRMIWWLTWRKGAARPVERLVCLLQDASAH